MVDRRYAGKDLGCGERAETERDITQTELLDRPVASAHRHDLKAERWPNNLTSWHLGSAARRLADSSIREIMAQFNPTGIKTASRNLHLASVRPRPVASLC
jgi:hypothetical protein